MPQQQLEQRELGPGEPQGALTSRYVSRDGVERQVGKAQHRPRFRRADPTQQRPQASEQLLERKWLRQVVVGTGVEPGDPIAHLVARGQHEHGNVVAGGAQRPAGGKTVQPGHHHVQDHRIRMSGPNHAQRLFTVVGQLDLVAVECQ
jgi:hypothetical protein